MRNNNALIEFCLSQYSTFCERAPHTTYNSMFVKQIKRLTSQIYNLRFRRDIIRYSWLQKYNTACVNTSQYNTITSRKSA